MNIDEFHSRYPDFVGYVRDGFAVGFETPILNVWEDIREKGDRVYLDQPFVFFWGGHRFKLAPGYWTDGASIPRLFWRVIGHPFGDYFAAAVGHDILYETEFLPRERSDAVLRDLIEVLPVPAWRRALIYRAVRLGGGPTWIKHTPASIEASKKYLEVTHVGKLV